MTHAKTFVSGVRPYHLLAEAQYIGADLLVVISGGNKPHIGSVAVALPRPSLRDPRVMSATSSVYNLPGHRDQALAQRVAEILASRLNCAVVVTAGFHLDGISEKGIAKVIANCEKLAQKIYAALSHLKPSQPDEKSNMCRRFKNRLRARARTTEK